MLYLQKKGQSIDDIAKSMDTSPEFIQFVMDKKLQFTPKHIDSYLKNTNKHFWEFAIEAIHIGFENALRRKKTMILR